MLLKARSESEELLVLRHLNTRMELAPNDKFHYSNLEKGYEGEKNSTNWLQTFKKKDIS